MRKQLKMVREIKGLASLPPSELASKLNQYQQLQALLTVPTNILVAACDRLILDRHIEVPASELRVSNYFLRQEGICFPSAVSSLGIRPSHPEPFAALCSAILRAYQETDTSNELSWRLGSDPSRGLKVTLTEFVRREGPVEAVSKLVLASHSVSMSICRELQLNLAEILPRTEETIPRMLWKFGFEIPRHDDVLERLHRRIRGFEELLYRIDLGIGESARESYGLRVSTYLFQWRSFSTGSLPTTCGNYRQTIG